ncbi:general secretion pathway protein GspB [Massilia phyllosphaerae]|uniref:general secretion pathway protein GspB n=1 Tax=Massilia phyllosphaerae TaxID=3106034 RepID=UPI002B1CDD39|nr:general secretion pathway protein GspB [Massilia sp. SGZ-792]
MSYILEALKKAQAERQLGNAPTIHAAQPVPALQPDAAASRRPLFIGLGAGALVVVLGAAFLWRSGPAQVPAVQVAQGQGQAPAAAPVTPAPVTPAPVTPAPMAAAEVPSAGAPAAGSPAAGSPAAGSPAAGSPAVANSLEVQAPPAPPPVRPAQPRVADAAAAAASRAAATPAAPAVQVRMPTPAPAAPVAAAPAPARAAAPAAVAAPAPEESLPFLQQLPESVQGGIPRVAFGGYMYSANPADRLLLVDKALRHEGEEVAPGLVLEKLLPRAAVMNYRGVRYRVAY